MNDQLASAQRTYVHFHCLITKGLNYAYCCLCTLTPSKYDVQIHISHSDHDLQCTCFPFLPACNFGNASWFIVDHKHTSGGRSFSDKSIDYHLYFWFLKNYKHGTQIVMEGIFQPKPYHHSCGAIIVVISEQHALAMMTVLHILTKYWQLQRMNNIIVHINNNDQFCGPSEDGKQEHIITPGLM